MVARLVVIWSPGGRRQGKPVAPAGNSMGNLQQSGRRWSAERKEAPGIYDRRGRVYACPLDRSAEGHHPCTIFLHAVESSGPAAVSGVSTTTNPPRSNASGAARCRRSSSSTRPTACPRATAGRSGTSRKIWFPTYLPAGQACVPFHVPGFSGLTALAGNHRQSAAGNGTPAGVPRP